MPACRSQSRLTRTIAASLLLATVGAGTAAAAGITLIGSESKSGSFAAVSITQEAAKPHAMYYKITTAPSGLEKDVNVLIHCEKGSKKKQKGPTITKSTSSRRVKVPVTIANPDTCTISIQTGLRHGSGKITAKLYKG